MQARLAAVKRRKKSVEITAGLPSEPNGFFLFRKRNPIEQLEQRVASKRSSSDEPRRDAATATDSENADEPASDPAL